MATTRLVLLRPCILLFPNYFCLRLPVCLAETTVSWWCSQNSCNYSNKRGVTDQALRAAGQWKSTAYQKYVRLDDPRRTTSVASSTAALASGRLGHTSTDALPAMVKTTEPSNAHPIVDPSGPELGRLQPLPHVTPVKVDLLRAELPSHPDRVFVSSFINALSYGARIGYTGPRPKFMAPNLDSADEHAAAISAFLTKECTAIRMARPSMPPL